MKAGPLAAPDHRTGVYYGITSYLIWGFLPLYWKLLAFAPALEILMHRILWSFIFICLTVTAQKNWRAVLQAARDRKSLAMIFSCGLLVSLNWYIYIDAVNSGQMVEASMGYFINPLVVVLLGVTVLKEKLGRWQLSAIILAFAGVFLMACQYGRIPWIALSLALTFALYGLIKKVILIEPVTGLVFETMIVAPLSLYFILRWELLSESSVFTSPDHRLLLLASTGIITLIPLLLYASGIKKTTFSMMGFLQYITPSINLFLGIFVFKEHFSLPYFFSFCFIWAGLVIFSLVSAGYLKERAQV